MADARLWVAFSVAVAGCLALDLGLGRRRGGRMPLRAAALWSAVWIGAALAFAVAIALFRFPEDPAAGRRDALLFLTSYIVEKSLSVDNMFVFIMIFSYFGVAEANQPRVLKWGILGALAFRGILIAVGAALIARFHWILYAFAALLVWAGWKMATHGDEEVHPEKNPVLRLFRRFAPVVDRFEGPRFFVRGPGGGWHASALAVVLVVIESTDVLFALDSIPAIFAITQDVFIVFTSNVFAILGLRALFFVLAGIMEIFRYLKLGVAAVLVFVGAKMLLHDVVEIPIGVSLGAIGGLLAVSILASLLAKRAPARRGKVPHPRAGAAAHRA